MSFVLKVEMKIIKILFNLIILTVKGDTFKMELMELPNIGLELQKKLIEVGIISTKQLKEIGAKEAAIQIKLKHDVCLHMLYALEGAIQGVRKPLLSKETKEDLKKFYSEVISK